MNEKNILTNESKPKARISCKEFFKNGYQSVEGDYLLFEEKFEIKSNDLKIGQLMGEGHFSDVYMGKLQESLDVAVKIPKRNVDSRIQKHQRNALRDELQIMCCLQQGESCGHANVVKLIGTITRSKLYFCILTEYCNFGSLGVFLQGKIKNEKFVNELIFEESEMKYGEEKKEVWKAHLYPCWERDYEWRRKCDIITTSDLLWFALQLARAMHFLNKNKVLHRDVAIRNLFLTSTYSLKLGDFGLSQRLYGDDEAYNNWRNLIAIPIRHCAIESLISQRFTIHSERWSFGVAVWEMFTFGVDQPYTKELENADIDEQKLWPCLQTYLLSGSRLNIPKTVPEKLKQLLTELWNNNPERRPLFNTCKTLIENELKKSCSKILQSTEDITHHSSEISLLNGKDANVPDSSNHYTSDESNCQKFTENCPAIRVIMPIALLLLICAVCLAVYELFVNKNPIFIFKKPISNFQQESKELNLINPMNPTDCLAILLADRNSKSGVYNIYSDASEPFSVYCDMKTDDGGWTAFQRRSINSSHVFYNQSWENYKIGFGIDDKMDNFWLGLDHIHQLSTVAAMVELRIELTGSQCMVKASDQNQIYCDTKMVDQERFGVWNKFRVDNESRNYALHVSEGGSLNSHDSLMKLNNNQMFTTYDRDNDESPINCARMRMQGAWWYKDCSCATCKPPRIGVLEIALNGKYHESFDYEKQRPHGIIWEDEGKDRTHDALYRTVPIRTEMKLRRVV